MKVYQYGLLPPHPDDAARVREQMTLAHRYRNALVEIEDGSQRLRDAFKISTNPANVAIPVRCAVAKAARRLQDFDRKTKEKRAPICGTSPGMKCPGAVSEAPGMANPCSPVFLLPNGAR